MNIKQEKFDPDEPYPPGDENYALNEFLYAKHTALTKYQREQLLKKACSIVKENILGSLPDIITDEQFLWFKNNKNNWQSMEKFQEALKEHYTGALQTKLENEIRKLIHILSESFFVSELQPLMSNASQSGDNLTAVVKTECTTSDQSPTPTDVAVSRVTKIGESDDYKPPEDGDSDDTIKRTPVRDETDYADVKPCLKCGIEEGEVGNCTCPKENQDKVVTRPQSSGAPLNHTSLPYLRFTVYGNPCSALINTGVARTFVGNRLVELCQNEGNTASQFDSKAAFLADGTAVTVTEVLHIPLKIGDTNFSHDCIILKGLKNDLLIGMDLVRRLDIKLSFPSAITESIANFNTSDLSKPSYIQVHDIPSTSTVTSAPRVRKRSHDIDVDSKGKKKKKSKSSKSSKNADFDLTSSDSSDTIMIRMGEELIPVPAHIPRTSRRFRRRVIGGVYTARWSRDGSLRSVQFTPRSDDSFETKSDDSLILSD